MRATVQRLRVGASPILLVLLLAAPGVVRAQGDITKDLAVVKKMAASTVEGVDNYLRSIEGRDVSELRANLRTQVELYGRIAREARECVAKVHRTLEKLDLSQITSGETFDGRFKPKVRQKLFGRELDESLDKLSDCRASDLMTQSANRPAINCCLLLNQDTLRQEEKAQLGGEFELADLLRQAWGALRADTQILDRTIQRTHEALARFDRKLIGGFPGMPWEYVFNIMGDINGPSPHQIIWAHFNLGFEDGVQVAPGDNRIQPVLTLQGLGYNRYFLSKDKGVWRKLNYLGVAGIITLNGRKGVTAVRYGGVVHFGNYVSVGSTYGDGAWRVYASSNKVVDQILKIWN